MSPRVTYNPMDVERVLHSLMEGDMPAKVWLYHLEKPGGLKFNIPLEQTPGILWQWNDYPDLHMTNVPDHLRVQVSLKPELSTLIACRVAVMSYAQFALGLHLRTMIYAFADAGMWDMRHRYTCSSRTAWQMLTPLRLFAPGRTVLNADTIAHSIPYIPLKETAHAP